ncbi:MAG: OmpA family protein [Myxococcales bacterium]|nr:OmpA family protein [Myxococcales bacterium]
MHCILLALALALSACASGSELFTQADYLENNLSRIHDAAYQCAERDLAMAEAHHEFARYELRRGSYLEAKRHLELSQQHTEAAMEIVDNRPDCWPDYVADTDGDGYLDDVDQCPRDPEDFDMFEDEDGCPELDNDGDGLNDPDDMCPLDPEDFDLFEDEDGCPELDNDNDGYDDPDDDCPNDPEDFDGQDDEDGCPEEDVPVLEFTVIHDDRIEITQQINFAYDSAEILADSYPVLNEVAGIILSNPAMRIRIEGHTDSAGRARYNLRLSDERAASVRTYLTERGIEAFRLESVGYGEERPIDTNDTAEGRANNRRVEFHIVAQ